MQTKQLSVWGTKAELRARVVRPQTSWSPPPPPVISLLDVQRRLFCFGSLVILDVARCYLCLFSLYINIKIGTIVVLMLSSRWPPVWKIAVQLVVACDVYDGVFCAVIFLTRGLGWNFELNWVSLWGCSYFILLYTQVLEVNSSKLILCTI